jgi:SPP1 gp7 family putative phage head morphogenesis protein
MYPLHLEKESAQIFRKIVSRKFKEINKEILHSLKKDLQRSNSSQITMDSSDFVIRMDSPELDRLLNDIRPTASLNDLERKQMIKSMASLDAWARSQVSSQIDNQVSKMNNPPRRPGVISSNRSTFRVPAIQLGNPESEQVIENLKYQVNKNIDEVSNLWKNHGDEVRNLVKENIAKGTRYSDLAKEIEKKTGVDEKRAESWARDQSQRFVSEQESIRAKNAGFPGFFWRTQRDSRVRDTHRHYKGKDLDGQYFTWDNLPVLNQQGTGMPGPLEPGQDYYCRCYKEFGFPPDNETQNKIDNPFQDLKFDRIKQMDTRKDPISGAFPKQRNSAKADDLQKKFHQKIEDMNKEERLRFIDRMRFATIDESNLDEHRNKFKNRGIEIKNEFGLGIAEMIGYVLKGKNYDQVTPYIVDESETVGFINESLGIFIAVAASRKRIKTIFPVDQDWIDYFYEKYRLLL